MSDSDKLTVRQELEIDLQLYGSCFWRIVDGEKVRVPHEHVLIEGDDRIFSIYPGEIFAQRLVIEERG